MQIARILWDLDDDPDGNFQHIAEHGITVEEVEEVLYAAEEVVASHSTGRPITFVLSANQALASFWRLYLK
jgi:hypothetical protein